MMKVQLLLLLALAGPLCAFTLSGSTVNPTHPTTGFQHTTGEIATQTVADPANDVSAVTGFPPTEPKTAAEVLAISTVPPHPADVTTFQTHTSAAPTVAHHVERLATETTEQPADDEVPKDAEEPVTTTEERVITTQPAHAEVPTDAEEPVTITQPAEVPPAATEGAKAAMEEDMIVESDTEGNLSTGQVVGIVIGALLAVAIVIAVVVAVLRRMGKYSP